MPRLEDLIRKKPRASKTSKAQTPAAEKPLAAIPEIVLSDPEDVEPEIPLIRKKPKTPRTPKPKGISINEPTPSPKPKDKPVEGKGKGKAVEPPPKRQKLTVIPNPQLKPPPLEATSRPSVDVSHRIALSSATNAADGALAAKTMAGVASSLNLLGSYFWEKLHGENPNHHLELGLYGAVLVSLTLMDSALVSFISVFTTYSSSFTLISEYAEYDQQSFPLRAARGESQG